MRLLERVSGVAARRSRLVLGLWLLLVLVALPFAALAPGRLSTGGFEVDSSESHREAAFLGDVPGHGTQPFTVVVQAPTAATARARAALIARRIVVGHPAARLAGPPVASADGRTVAVTVLATVDQAPALALSAALKREFQVTSGATRQYVAGPSPTFESIKTRVESSVRSAEVLTLPLVAIVLLVLFGALVATTLPLLLGAACVAVTMAAVFAVASATEMSVYASSMVSMIGIGVAVDYSLFVLARYREEVAAGSRHEVAVATAFATSGTAVVFSGITVIIALASILIVPVRAIQSMALGAMMVTAVAVLAVSTFLPALLDRLGRSVDRGRVPGVRAAGDSARWDGFVRRVMRRPGRWFCAAALLLLALAAPIVALRTATTGLSQLPSDDPSVRGSRLLSREITGPGRGVEGQLVVAVIPRPGAGRPTAGHLVALARALRRVPHVTGTTIAPAGAGAELRASIDVDPESADALGTLLQAARDAVHAEAVPSETIAIGGLTAYDHDVDVAVSDTFWEVVALAVGATFLVLTLLLRSLLLPLKAVVMNLLSIGASYGVLVAVFQWGWLGWAGVEAPGHVNTLSRPLIFAVTFGLSMDYEVFLLSRIAERYRSHGDNERAVREGISSSARLITGAASIMVLVFGAFALIGVQSIREIGVGLAVAIAVDATVTRLVLVPATMRLLGDWNWWLPRWLDRLLPRLGGEGAPRPRLSASGAPDPRAGLR